MPCQMVLRCLDMQQELRLALLQHAPSISSLDMSTLNVVYENGVYDIDFYCDEYAYEGVEAINLILNGTRIKNVETVRNGRYILGKCSSPKNQRGYYVNDQPLFQPFLTQCDLVALAFEIIMTDETTVTYFSDYLLCVSRDEKDSANIQSIIEDLSGFNNPQVENWLFSKEQDKPNALRQGAWMHHAYKSYSSYLQLMENIVLCYRNNYSLFRAFGKHTINKKNVLLPYSKVRSISANSFQWLMQNSTQLSEVSGIAGLNYEGTDYIPTRIKSEVSEKTWDTYENRVVISFLDSVLKSGLSIYQTLIKERDQEERIIKKIRDTLQKGYIAPVITIKTLQLTTIRKTAERLSLIINSLKQLLNQYTSLFCIIPGQIVSLPRKTKSFQEIRPYIHVFEMMMRWYEYGEYDLSREDLILRVKTLEKLFEYYCLIKLLEMFQKNGYIQSSKATSFHYENYESEDEIPNTYYLQKGETKVTIYYQPVIRSDCFQNEIELYQISYDKRIYYCTPDFVIKCEKDGKNDYIIFDSKFATRKTIINHRLQNIVRQYAIETAVARPSMEPKSDAPKMVWALQGRIDNAKQIMRLVNSSLSDTYRPVSCGIVSINSMDDSRPALWREMKKCIPWI